MKNSNAAKKHGMRKMWRVLFVVIAMITLICCPVLATDPPAVDDDDDGGGSDLDNAITMGHQRIDIVIQWIVSWVAKIGLVVAFFGGVQVALGFMNDDADAKVSGMKTLAAGFMVYGICAASNTLFFIL